MYINGIELQYMLKYMLNYILRADDCGVNACVGVLLKLISPYNYILKILEMRLIVVYYIQHICFLKELKVNVNQCVM